MGSSTNLRSGRSPLPFLKFTVGGVRVLCVPLGHSPAQEKGRGDNFFYKKTWLNFEGGEVPSLPLGVFMRELAACIGG